MSLVDFTIDGIPARMGLGEPSSYLLKIKKIKKEELKRNGLKGYGF